jgi:crotonobetainyl-CoA:carnitine CoA-transferase CaiB-like acyl-CoA transferase
MVAPLDGVRVLEMTSWMAAPSAGAILADLGADVVKVEPPRGDPMRTLTRQPKLEPDDPRAASDPGFLVDNRGKRSITVAVDTPEGADLVRRLLADREVFLTNLLPRRQERYGLDPTSVFAVAPRIVHATLTGYGKDGPEAWRPGYDVTAFFGRGTISDASIEPEGHPPLPRPAQGDHTTGLAMVAAILAALRLADRTGQGQACDVSLFGTAVWTQATDIAPALLDRQPVTKRGRHDLILPLANRFRCADDRWIIFNMPENHWWPRFCAAVGKPEWAADERFQSVKGRYDHMKLLMVWLDELLGTRTLAEWAKVFDDAGLIWGPAQAIHEVVDDPQARAAGLFAPVPGGPEGLETVAVPIKIAGADIAPRGMASPAGADTETVLIEAGLDAAEIADLRAAGAIG